MLVIGADGLRPDLVDPALMPTVARLAAGGVRFLDHHSVYPPHTRAAVASLATGCGPGRHGLLANQMLVPGATEDGVVDSSDWRHLDALDRFTGGRALAVPALGELLAARGRGERVAVASTGSGGGSLLWTRHDRGRIVNPQTAYGLADLYALREKLGSVSEAAHGPGAAWADYATRAAVELFLPDPANRVVVLWLDELDHHQHYAGLGSPEARAAMATIDRCLAAVLAALDKTGTREGFDVLFLSDHGQSTLASHRTLGEWLGDAAAELCVVPPLATAGDFVYPAIGSPAPTAAELAPLVGWLLRQPWCEAVLGGRPALAALPGVLPLDRVWGGNGGDRAPLLAVAPAWDEAPNGHGVPGRIAGLTAQPALRASHGSLSPYDLGAVLIGNGPGFREGVGSALPSGVVDVLPTVLTLLGVPVPEGLDGRVLGEGLREPPAGTVPDGARAELIEPVAIGGAARSASVRLDRVGGATYVHGTVPCRWGVTVR